MKFILSLKRMAVLTVGIALSISLIGCGDADNNSVSQTEPETEPKTVQTVTVSCAGDCTLASDEGFSGNTFESVLSARDNDYSYFFKNVKSIFEEDDITIVNLECTLSDRGSRADKTFAFRGDPQNVEILTNGSVEAVTLANNHSLDYGSVSLEDTMSTLDEAGIPYAYNTEVVYKEVDGIRIAIIGLYQLDGSSDELIDSVMTRVYDADLKIVQVHWGIEKDSVPSDAQVNLAHRAIDLGADLVIGHHPHVLQGVEKYKGKYICYSLGNFCFGGNPNPSDTDTMIFRQTFSFREGAVAKTDDYEIIPCSITSASGTNNYQPTPLKGDEKERVQKKIQSRTDSISDELSLKFRD